MPSPPLPSGTVTFLFSDIEGSTSLLKRLGDVYGQVLADHQRLLRESFGRRDGLEIDTQGDAFFVVFPRAKDAVAAALDAQRALRDFTWPGEVDVKVRMGMHTGEPSVAAERYIGLGVHRGARVCAAAHGGQILLSQSTFALLVDDVLPDIGFRDLGDHRLKDLDRPERLPAHRPRPAVRVSSAELPGAAGAVRGTRSGAGAQCRRSRTRGPSPRDRGRRHRLAARGSRQAPG